MWNPHSSSRTQGGLTQSFISHLVNQRGLSGSFERIKEQIRDFRDTVSKMCLISISLAHPTMMCQSWSADKKKRWNQATVLTRWSFNVLLQRYISCQACLGEHFVPLSNVLFRPFSPAPASGRYIDLLGKSRHLTLSLIEKGHTFHWMRYVTLWVACHSLAGFRLWGLFINAALSLSCMVQTLRFPNHCRIMCWKAGIWRCISTERSSGLDRCHFLLLVSVIVWIHWVLNIAFVSKIQASWRLHVKLSLLSETWALNSLLGSQSTPRLSSSCVPVLRAHIWRVACPCYLRWLPAGLLSRDPVFTQLFSKWGGAWLSQPLQVHLSLALKSHEPGLSHVSASNCKIICLPVHPSVRLPIHPPIYPSAIAFWDLLR